MSEDNFRVEKGAENQPVNEAQNNGGKIIDEAAYRIHAPREKGMLDLYLVVVYKAYLRYLTTFHDTLIISPDSSVLFFCLPQQLPPLDFP